MKDNTKQNYEAIYINVCEFNTHLKPTLRNNYYCVYWFISLFYLLLNTHTI